MPGRHASPDRSRFRRDLTRMTVLAVLAAVVVAALAFSVRFLTGSEGEPATAAGQAPSSTAEPPAPPASTAAAENTTTTAAAPSTTAAVETTAAAPTTTTAPTLPPAAPTPMREPGQIIVLVLNSTQTAGLAGQVTDQLSELGYRTEDPDNHPTSLGTSVVWYLDGFEREAEALAEEIPDANIEPFTGDVPRAHLTVVLGASYLE